MLDPDALRGLEHQLGRDYLKELLREFLLQARRYLRQAERAVAALDDPDALRAAHDLKSTSINFGFLRLSALAGAMEAACRAGDASRAAEVANSLPSCLDRSLEALARIYPEVTAAAE